MHLFYICGGGAGHLSRTKKFIKLKKLKDYLILTYNPLAFDFFISSEILFINSDLNNIHGYIKELQNTIDHVDPDIFITDCFPLGILGELNDIEFKDNLVHEHICRYVDYHSYINKIRKNFCWDKIYSCEELQPMQYEFLSEHSSEIELIDFTFLESNKTQKIKENTWLIYHSGPEKEVLILLKRAKSDAYKLSLDPNYLILTFSPFKDKSFNTIKTNDGTDYFQNSERIYIGGGFNTIHETANHRYKTHVIAFKRKYDDQLKRIKHAYSDIIRDEK